MHVHVHITSIYKYNVHVHIMVLHVPHMCALTASRCRHRSHPERGVCTRGAQQATLLGVCGHARGQGTMMYTFDDCYLATKGFIYRQIAGYRRPVGDRRVG